MKKKKQALIFLAVAVLLIAAIAIFRPSVFQPEGSQNPSATASQSSLDVWTAAPAEETPVPAPSSASEQTSVLTDVPTDAPKPGPTESPVIFLSTILPRKALRIWAGREVLWKNTRPENASAEIGLAIMRSCFLSKKAELTMNVTSIHSVHVPEAPNGLYGPLTG